MEWQDLSFKRNRAKRIGQKANHPESRLSLPDGLSWHFLLGMVAAVILIWLASGFYLVRPGEVALIQRFGKGDEISKQEGIHYHLPAPIERVVRLQVKEIKSLEIGFRTTDPGPPARYREIPAEASMLLRGENIMLIKAAVQYQISDPHDYLLNIEDQEKTVRNAAESALRQVIGQHTVESVLSSAKQQIQQQTQRLLQQILDRYRAGIKVASVELREVHPPAEVAEVLKKVDAAKDERDRLISKAREYLNEEMSKARAEAERMVSEAESYRDEIIRRAEGDTARFLKNYAQYRGAEEISRKKLYLEAMEQILSGAQKYVLMDTDQRFIGLLPLGSPGLFSALTEKPTLVEKPGISLSEKTQIEPLCDPNQLKR